MSYSVCVLVLSGLQSGCPRLPLSHWLTGIRSAACYKRRCLSNKVKQSSAKCASNPTKGLCMSARTIVSLWQLCYFFCLHVWNFHAESDKCFCVVGMLLRGTENFWGNETSQFLTPITLEPLERICPNFNNWAPLKLSTNPKFKKKNLAFIFQYFVKNLMQFTVFGGIHPLLHTTNI